MDIALNKPLDYHTLHSFLKQLLPTTAFFLLYEGLNEWEDAPAGQAIFQYMLNEDNPGPFKYGLSIFTDQSEPLFLIERLAHALAQTFRCSTLCDASRVVLKEKNVYYSLLFEAGQVYLVDDYNFEESGEVSKIVGLNYKLPTVPE